MRCHICGSQLHQFNSSVAAVEVILNGTDKTAELEIVRYAA